MLYGILLAVFKLQDGAVVCLIQGFQKLKSQDGARPFANEYDCPLLELTRTIFSTPGGNILRAVSVVHECGASCRFEETQTIENVERQEITRTKLTFEHDWSNTLYSYNVYCVL